MKKPRVVVCVPCRDQVMAGFCFDLAKLMAYEGKRNKVEIEVMQMTGTLIFTQRERLSEEGLNWKADYLLWIDSDMRFPKDTLQVLLERNKDIVGVNATSRVEPIKPTAMNLIIKNEKEHSWIHLDSLKRKSIEKVTAVGFGVTLVKTSILAKIPRPWFNVMWSDHGAIIGEDIHFCIKAQDAGFEVYVDHDLSKAIGHIGTRTFGWKDIENGTLDIRRPPDHDSELSGKVGLNNTNT